MKHRSVAEAGAHKTDDLNTTIRELKELEAELRRTGMMRQAKTCATAARMIKSFLKEDK